MAVYPPPPPSPLPLPLSQLEAWLPWEEWTPCPLLFEIVLECPSALGIT